MLNDEALCRPAIVWDVRGLRALADDGADAFVESLGAGPFRPPEATSPTDNPLALAAAAVILARHGEGDRARAILEQVAGSPWRDLLRTCLFAWLPSDNSLLAIRASTSALNAVDDDDLRPRVLAKLAGIAVDRNHFDVGLELLDEAVGLAPPGSRLSVYLSLAHSQLAGTFPGFVSLVGLPDDPLVEQEWIESSALSAGQEQLAETLAARARNPWSTSIRFGRTAADQIVAAEQQATWAGALWLRPALRKQAGAQMLLGDGTAAQLSYGMMMWISGGGGDRRAVADFVEPDLTGAEIAQLVRTFLGGEEPTGSRQHAAAELVLAWWDCLEPTLVEEVLTRLQPSEGRFPLGRDIRRLWAVLARQQLPIWTQRFAALPAQQRAAIAVQMDPQTIHGAPDAVAASLAQCLGELPVEEAGAAVNPWLTRIAIAELSGTELPDWDPSLVGASDLVDVAHFARDRVSDSDLERAAGELVASIDRSIAEAQEGRFGFGASSAEAILGEAIILLGEQGRRHVSALERSIAASWHSGEARLEALTSLARIASDRGIGDDTAERIRQAPLDVPALEFLPVGPELLEAAKLLALADRLSEDDAGVLAALARSDDARVRQLAINATGLAYRRAPTPMLGSSLVGALFDPSPEVIARGLTEIASSGVPDGLRVTVSRRATTLIRSFPRRVRAGVAALAARDASGSGEFGLSAVLEAARKDKSWQVRHAACEPGSHE